MKNNTFEKHIYCKPLILLIIILIVSACNNDKKEEDIKNKHQSIDFKEPLIKANKHLNNAEDDEINGYIKRHQWNMTKTNSGLRYWIYKKGNGLKVNEGMVATLSYILSFINGYVCYNSETEGYKIINVGTSDTDKGLQEALLLMNKGDKARIIIPSYLAYGLIGDGDKIPAKATLVYDIAIIRVCP